MTLLERARALRDAGFLGDLSEADLPPLLAEAENETGIDTGRGPATALLLAAGKLLEIPADDAQDPEEYLDLMARAAEFCGLDFGGASVEEESLGDDAVLLRIRYRLGEKDVVSEVTCSDEMIDLGFLCEFEEALSAKGDARRLCPVDELMDDTARYVFMDPDIVERAELDELIAATDFED